MVLPAGWFMTVPGQWDRNLNWHEGNVVWPQQAYIEEFIKEIERRQKQ